MRSRPAVWIFRPRISVDDNTHRCVRLLFCGDPAYGNFSTIGGLSVVQETMIVTIRRLRSMSHMAPANPSVPVTGLTRYR